MQDVISRLKSLYDSGGKGFMKSTGIFTMVAAVLYATAALGQIQPQNRDWIIAIPMISQGPKGRGK